MRKYVLFSGGKDSLVVLHLLREEINAAIYVDTGISFPENNAYIREICNEFGINLITLKPERDFFDLVQKWGFPTIKTLWCRRWLKIEPLRMFFRKIKPPAWTYLGIRLAESPSRRKFYSKLPRGFQGIQRYDEKTGSWQFFPIAEWSDSQVWEYIRKHNLKINPCYKLYGHAACYFCPFLSNPKYYLRLKAVHPELFQKLLEAEERMRNRSSALIWGYKKIWLHDLARFSLLEGYQNA